MQYNYFTEVQLPNAKNVSKQKKTKLKSMTEHKKPYFSKSNQSINIVGNLSENSRHWRTKHTSGLKQKKKNRLKLAKFF